MKLVIDANEYIFAFSIVEESPNRELLDYLLAHTTRNKIFICRTIINEVQRNLTAALLKDFFEYVYSACIVDEDYVVPFDLGAVYESEGLKPADAFIAAYAEHGG